MPDAAALAPPMTSLAPASLAMASRAPAPSLTPSFGPATLRSGLCLHVPLVSYLPTSTNLLTSRIVDPGREGGMLENNYGGRS